MSSQLYALYQSAKYYDVSTVEILIVVISLALVLDLALNYGREAGKLFQQVGVVHRRCGPT